MPRNQKLTNVIRGRTVERATAEPGKLVIKFNDESTMQVKTAGIANIFPPGGQIKAVQKDDGRLTLQFEDGPTATLQLADPGASVAVRGKDNQVGYRG